MVDKNSQIRKKFIIFLVAILVLTPFVFIFLKYSPAWVENKKQISQLESELSKTKNEIRSLETQINDFQIKENKEISTSQDKLTEALNEVDTLKKQSETIKISQK